MRKVIASIGFILLILAVVSGVTLLMGGFDSDKPFDAVQWKADAGHGGGRSRARMVESLKKDFLKVGMSHAEVEALLGEPDDRDNQVSGHYYNYRYGIGRHFGYIGRSGFGFYHYRFVVNFDPSGRLAVSFTDADLP